MANTGIQELQNIASNSSANAVTAAYSLLGPINSYSDLLDKSNPRNKAVCLAAEQVIHMAESWRYFSSAMYAYLNHAPGNAIHFAYYAELRAALSLFSGSGIRIKFNDSYWIDDASVVRRISKANRTHSVAVDIWNTWRKRPDSQALLEDNIHIEAGVTLKHFKPELIQFNTPELLGYWGYDLVNLQIDHRARDQKSYDAYWLEKPLSRMTVDQLDFVRMLSKLFLSSGSGLLFDQAFIQYAVHRTVKGSLDEESQENPTAQLAEKLNKIVDFAASQSGADKDRLLMKLSGNMGELIFEKANQPDSTAENILSRAAFLARLAMLSVKQNIASSGNDHAKRWLRNWLEQCGTWQPSLGVSVGDIEADLNDALDNFAISASVIPADLWNSENAFFTSRIINLHACIAWGVAA